MRLALAAAAATVLLAAPALGAVKPAPGELDLSWGGTGFVITPFAGDYSFADGLATKDNETSAVGGVGQGSSGDFAIARYGKDGALVGQVTTDFTGGSTDLATAATYMGDKLLVVGYTSPDNATYNWAIARYNKDLSLDQSFGSGGKVVVSFGDGYDFANGVGIKGDKIIVDGEAMTGGGGQNFGLARLNKDGSLDQSFGTGGLVTTDFGGGTDSAGGVTFVGDRIVAGGYVQAGNFDFGAAAYNKDGSLDQSFGTGGKVITDFGAGDDFAHAIDSKGDKIVLVGEASNGSDQDFAAAQYDKRGVLDPGFGTGGRTRLDMGGDDRAFGGAYQDDGLVVAAGATPQGFGDQFAVARWTKAGAPDPAFGGGDGFTTTLIGGESGAFALALGQDQTILAAGYADDDVAVARYIGKKK